jgi:hypothetical protein
MAAGADSIEDMYLLRHGAMPMLFGDIRAPSTLGSFLRFTWRNVLQLQKVHRQVLAELAGRARLVPGKDVLAFVDADSQQKQLRARQAGRCVWPYEDRRQGPAGPRA